MRLSKTTVTFGDPKMNQPVGRCELLLAYVDWPKLEQRYFKVF